MKPKLIKNKRPAEHIIEEIEKLYFLLAQKNIHFCNAIFDKTDKKYDVLENKDFKQTYEEKLSELLDELRELINDNEEKLQDVEELQNEKNELQKDFDKIPCLFTIDDVINGEQYLMEGVSFGVISTNLHEYSNLIKMIESQKHIL